MMDAILFFRRSVEESTKLMASLQVRVTQLIKLLALSLLTGWFCFI